MASDSSVCCHRRITDTCPDMTLPTHCNTNENSLLIRHADPYRLQLTAGAILQHFVSLHFNSAHCHEIFGSRMRRKDETPAFCGGLVDAIVDSCNPFHASGSATLGKIYLDGNVHVVLCTRTAKHAPYIYQYWTRLFHTLFCSLLRARDTAPAESRIR